MKRLVIIGLVLFILTVTGGNLFSSTLRVNTDYNMPIGNIGVNPNVSFGAGVKFWGIFLASGAVYTEIIYGAENIFNISGFRPIGLFSYGLGMVIPLGNISLIMDWQNFYTGAGYEKVDRYSDSYKIGMAVNLSETFSLEFYSRTLFNFTDNALASNFVNITDPEETVQMIGLGAVLHLF